MSIRHIAILLAVLFVAACSAAPATTEKFTGKYTLRGETPTGEAYQGSMELTPRGPGLAVDWQPPKAATSSFGLQLDQVVGVVVEDKDPYPGIVLYRVRGGHLEGIWRYASGTAGLGHEELDGPEGLQGEYTISLGRNPGAYPYYGKVTIQKHGNVYFVDWHIVDSDYIGTGVLVGDVFVVGYALKHRAGVAAYCLRSASSIEGVTATAEDSGYGAEVLLPQSSVAPPDAADRLKALRAGGITSCGSLSPSGQP